MLNNLCCNKLFNQPPLFVQKLCALREALHNRIKSFLVSFHGSRAQLYELHEAAVRNYQYTHSHVEGEEQITAKWDEVFSSFDFEKASSKPNADKATNNRNSVALTVEQFTRPVTLSQFFAKLSHNDALERASVFIADAVYNRDILHKTDKFAIRLYWLYNHIIMRTIMFLLLLFQLCFLILFEEPFATFRFKMSGTGIIQACELSILLIILIRFIMYFRIYGWDNLKQNVWKIAIALLLILSFAEAVVSIFFPQTFRLSRILRPLFFAEHVSPVRHRISLILKTVLKMPEFFLLLFFMIIFFGLIGYTLFSTALGDENPDPYFATLFDSLLTVFCLQTTAMFPEALVPSYKKTAFASFYFITFMVVQCFFVLTLDIAMVYNYYREELENVKLSNYVRNRVAMLAAFKMLQEYEPSAEKIPQAAVTQQDRTSEDSSKHETVIQVNARGEKKKISSEFKQEEEANPTAMVEQLKEISNTEQVANSQQAPLQSNSPHSNTAAVQQAKEATAADVMSTTSNTAAEPQEQNSTAAQQSQEARVSKQTWIQLFMLIRPRSSVEKAAAKYDAVASTAGFVNLLQFIKLCSVIFVRIPTRLEDNGRKFFKCCRIRKLKYIVDSRIFKFLIILAVMLSCILVVVELVQIEFASYHFYNVYIEPFFIAVFFIEMMMKILARGLFKYLSKKWNIFDGSIVILSTILYILNLISVPILQTTIFFAAMRLLSLARFIRTFSVSKRLRLIADTFSQVVPIAMVQFTIVLLWYYSYGLIGMHLMYGVLQRPAAGDVNNPLIKTDYHYFNFYDVVNFNSFFNMLLTMFHLTVVSGWQMTMKAYMVVLNSNWICLYFMFFWLVTVLILMNLVVASVLDIFAIQFQANREMLMFKQQKNEEKMAQLQQAASEREDEANQFLTRAARASLDRLSGSGNSARNSIDTVATARSQMSLDLNRSVSIELLNVRLSLEKLQAHEANSSDDENTTSW